MATAPVLPGSDFQAPRLDGWVDGLHMLPVTHAQDPRLHASWKGLVHRAIEPNPFFEPWFLKASISHLAPNEPIEFAAYVSDCQLRGLLPIARSSSYYGNPIPQCSTWLHENAFCGVPLIEAGHEQDFWRALFYALDDDPRQSLFMHIPGLPADGPVAQAMRAVCAAQSREEGIVDREVRAFLSSDCDALEYVEQSLSSKKRKELRRQHKRLSEEGKLSFERLDGSKGLADWTDEFLSLERAGWKGAEGSALACAPETRGLFVEALIEAARAGRLELLALRLDGSPIAMLANFITTPGAYSFKTTFDERFAKFSPGLLLQLENLALLDRPDIVWADSCAVEGHSMIERLWREKRTMVATNIAIGGGVRRTMFKQLLRRETKSLARRSASAKARS
ncbi:MAG: GNAT family N-acetyltransferase [Pseudomonadota bacterium]